jgi:hypothetical protein
MKMQARGVVSCRVGPVGVWAALRGVTRRTRVYNTSVVSNSCMWDHNATRVETTTQPDNPTRSETRRGPRPSTGRETVLHNVVSTSHC